MIASVTNQLRDLDWRLKIDHIHVAEAFIGAGFHGISRVNSSWRMLITLGIHLQDLKKLPYQLWPLAVSCMVLFFSRPRCKGWPHHGRTLPFIAVPVILTDSFMAEFCPRIDVVYPGRAWSSSPVCTWHCSSHNLFLQAIPLYAQGATLFSVPNNSLFTPALL